MVDAVLYGSNHGMFRDVLADDLRYFGYPLYAGL
jgi:hypothetical protein